MSSVLVLLKTITETLLDANNGLSEDEICRTVYVLSLLKNNKQSCGHHVELLLKNWLLQCPEPLFERKDIILVKEDLIVSGCKRHSKVVTRISWFKAFEIIFPGYLRASRSTFNTDRLLCELLSFWIAARDPMETVCIFENFLRMNARFLMRNPLVMSNDGMLKKDDVAYIEFLFWICVLGSKLGFNAFKDIKKRYFHKFQKTICDLFDIVNVNAVFNVCSIERLLVAQACLDCLSLTNYDKQKQQIVFTNLTMQSSLRWLFLHALMSSKPRILFDLSHRTHPFESFGNITLKFSCQKYRMFAARAFKKNDVISEFTGTKFFTRNVLKHIGPNLCALDECGNYIDGDMNMHQLDKCKIGQFAMGESKEHYMFCNSKYVVFAHDDIPHEVSQFHANDKQCWFMQVALRDISKGEEIYALRR